ncbi:MAG: UDP-2,3-diacylglucosamine diphosphatase [Flavobacteriales bacterium]|nr:UDP-2,3-diacylglucosamine diphosphatase [Flavobacteriales bacterium]
MNTGKNIYFASDLHLGVDGTTSSLERERAFVRWLDEVGRDAEEIHLVGDVFDFWFEYSKAVPKGFVRTLGKLAELCDRGIPVYMYLGNHDMWLFDYLPEEIGVQIVDGPVIRNFGDKKFYIAHGDGLGPGDHGYKFIKSVFRNKVCQWLFARIHPNLGIRIAQYFSQRSRAAESEEYLAFLGEEKEWLIIHSNEILEQDASIDYFIYGHRHLPMQIDLAQGATCINLGDWISHFTYAVFNGEETQLLTYDRK